MPLFGIQLFLSEADVGTIYCRQHIRCAYRHTRSRSGIDWLQNFNCGLYLRSNSLNKKMDSFLVAVRDINHKHIVVE